MADQTGTAAARAEDSTRAESSFDWAVYADATLAGLAALIPVPYVDSAIERYFRLRMLPAIAARNDAVLHPRANKAVNHVRFDLASRAGGCLLWPLGLAVSLARRLSRKFVYVLTVKRAVDQLSHYWQRAFLLNHMVRRGHASDAGTLRPAAQALDRTLAAHDEGPLVGLARQVVGATAGMLGEFRPGRALRWSQAAVRRGAFVPNVGELMRSSWDQYEDFFAQLRQEYDEAYEQALAEERRSGRV